VNKVAKDYRPFLHVLVFLICLLAASGVWPQTPAAAPVRFLTRIGAIMFFSSTSCIHNSSPSSLTNDSYNLPLLFSIGGVSFVLILFGKRWGDGDGVREIDGAYYIAITSTDSLLNRVTG